jgi:GT2 family glycosyltransferase
MNRMGVEPSVFVLLVNWRGWRDTIECLESVFRQDHGRMRVVVCNNDPTDDSLARIESWARGEYVATGPDTGADPHSVKAIPKPIPVVLLDRAAAEAPGSAGDAPQLTLIETGDNLGFAGANNVGLRYAFGGGDAEYVWLLNNDTVVAPDALRALVEIAEREPAAGMVGSKLLEYDRPDVLQLAGGGRVVPWRGLTTYFGIGERDRGQWERVLELDYVAGASLLVRRAAVEQIGGLDERFFLYSEEVDWCLRARARGWTLLYAPASRVWHKGGQSVRHRSPLHDYYTVRSMLLLVQKFRPGLLPFTFLYTLYRCLAPKVVRLQFVRLLAVLRAYADFVRMWLSPSRTANPPRPLFPSAGQTKGNG